MSLINEALKRTRDAGYQPTNVPPVIDAPKYLVDEPVGEEQSERKNIGGIIDAVVVVGAVVLGYATGFLGPHRQAAKTVEVAPEPKVNEEPTVARVVEKIKAEQKETLDPLATPPAPAPVVPVAPSPRELPKLTLQGIGIDGKSRDAMINNITLRVGEEIDGAKVTAIEVGRVTLDFEGREIILRVR